MTCTRSARLAVQPLEGRLAPANVTVTFSPLTHVLTVVGDNAANDLTIQGDASDPTHFTLTSTGTINGIAGPFSTPSGVRNMAMRLLAGNDQVGFGNSPAVHLTGSLSINGGDGANSVTASALMVDKGLTITNGVGNDSTTLLDVSVGGSLTVRNGSGDSFTRLARISAPVSAIRGSVLVTNGAGQDHTELTDVNVGGGVNVQNGLADAGGAAGLTVIFNNFVAGFRSQIRGGVSVSFLDGNVGSSGLSDVEVGGDVTFAFGSGSFSAFLDGFQVLQPVAVRGNLTLTGTGIGTVSLGTGLSGTGLVVGKALRVTTGSAADSVTLSKTDVGGATTLRLGDGANMVRIDNSEFVGAFNVTTGAGTDAVFLDTAAGTTAATTFKRPVTILQGAGVDSLILAGSGDANQALVFLGSFVVHHGVEADTLIQTASHLYFPFGTALQYVV